MRIRVGRPLHNNPAELEMRDVAVLQKNTRHKLVNAEDMRVFSMLFSVAHTCYRWGIHPWRYVSTAVGERSAGHVRS